MENYKKFLIAAGLSLSVNGLANSCPARGPDDEARYKEIAKRIKEAKRKADKLTKEVEESGKIKDLERLSELSEILKPLEELKDIPMGCREKYGVSKDGNNYACGNSSC